MSRQWTVCRICLLMFGCKGLILLWIYLLYFDIISFTFCFVLFFHLFITFRIWSSRCGSVLSSPGCVCCSESIGRDVSWETRLDKGNPPLDEGLTRKTSAWNSIRWPSYIINSVDKSKLSCYTPPPTQHHRFFSKFPPFWIKISLVSSKMVWCTLNILSRECHYVLSCALMGSFVVVSGYALLLLLVRKCLVFQILLAIDNNSHFTHNLTLINMGPVRSVII